MNLSTSPMSVHEGEEELLSGSGEEGDPVIYDDDSVRSTHPKPRSSTSARRDPDKKEHTEEVELTSDSEVGSAAGDSDLDATQPFMANNETPTWRNNWFVKNILAEAPIVGDFFRAKTCTQALFLAGKSVCELTVGGVAMAFTPVEPEESIAARYAKLTAAMAVGASAGGMVCNTISSGITTLYQCCQRRAVAHRENTKTKALKASLRAI